MHERNFSSVVLFAAALGSGIVGGSFFALDRSVMTALGQIPATQEIPQGIVAINAINVVVSTSIFTTLFLGTSILCLAITVRSLFRWNQPAAKYALTGCMAYLLGCVVVTMMFNIFLSNRMAFANSPACIPALNACNYVRSAAGILAVALFSGALYRRSER